MKASVLSLFLFASAFVYAQTNFQVIHSVNEGRCVRTTKEGGYVLAGTMGAYGGAHAVLMKYDCNGMIEWVKSYGETAAYHHYAYSVEQTKDGGYIVTGAYRASGNVSVMKTSKYGDVEWYKTFAAVEGWKVKQTTDEGYIIIANPNYFIKTDKSGNLQWARMFSPSSGTIIGYDIKQTLDSGYVAIASRFIPGVGEDGFVTKVDKNGNLQWAKSYNIDSDDKGYSILQLSTGEYILEGYSMNGSASNCNNFLIKTDISGNIIWAKSYPLANPNTGYPGFFNEVQPTLDGGFIFGYEYSGASGYKTFLTKVDNAGSIVWSKAYGDGYLHSLSVTPDNGVIFAGWKNGVYLVKTDSLGVSGCNESVLNAQQVTIAVTISSPALTVTPAPVQNTPAIITFKPGITSAFICANTIACKKDTIVVTTSSLQIPNVFTPDGNGVNDVFHISGSNLKNLDTKIYNRWGIKVYEWEGVDGFWDGRTNAGIECSPGTYYYLITATGKDGKGYEEKGFLTLIR